MRALFDEARALDPERRRAYLEQACPDDPDLRAEAASLLDAAEQADAFLGAPALAGGLRVTADLDPTVRELSPSADDLGADRIGPYQVLGLIGHGGMGSVYRARRADEAFEKVVALKVVRAAVDSQFVRTRFHAERQILARLEHPHIARLIDGGTTEQDRPYLVMEHVDGERIDRWAERRGLDIDARLRLFLPVCSAVAYAHRNLVVHRDLKPANILVTAEGMPKLLDFGIAKLLETGEGGEPTLTMAALMTPEYASPEQVRGEPITTASDVYALGVVLYELLTGRRPYRLRGRHMSEIVRVVCEEEPQRPSTAVSRPAEPGDGTSPTQRDQRLARALSGDIDAIVMMALRKEPQRRYSSVEAFSEDIRRYLEGRPVGARKGTLGYRAGKFIRRNSRLIAAAVVVFALAIGFGVNTAVQARRVARERDKAERVSAFLVDLFEVSDPDEARGNTVTAREMLDKGAAKIEAELKGQPEVRATLMDTMGRVYMKLGLYDKALPLFEEALRTRKQLLGNEHLEVAASLNSVASVLYFKGKLDSAEVLYREALGIRRKLLGNEHPDVATSLNNLANVLDGKDDQAGAETLYREVLAMRRKLLGNEHPDVASTLRSLGSVLLAKGDYAGAEALNREALAMQRKFLGNEHPSVARSLNSLAVVLKRKGDPAGAEALYREALAMKRRLLGNDHLDVASSLNNLGNLLGEKGDYPGAEAHLQEALAIYRKVRGNEHPDVARSLTNLADVWRAAGEPVKAEPLYRQALEMRRRALPKGHTDTADSLLSLATLLSERGGWKEAEPLAREGLDIERKADPHDDADVAWAESVLGGCLTSARRYDEAEPLLLGGYSILKAKRGERTSETREALERIVTLYDAWGKPQKAAEYRAMRESPPRSSWLDPGGGPT